MSSGPAINNPSLTPSTARGILSKLAASPHSIVAEQCRRDFFKFVQEFWHEIIPEEPVYNWHIEFLCQELQEEVFRVIRKEPKKSDIIINIPPGSTKSTIATVMLPAWAWVAREPKTRCTGEYLRFITASYSSSLSLEHADLSRDIVRSDKFKLYFPDVKIRRDKEIKSNYKLEGGGNRFSTSVGGSVTGVHGHFIIVDDPLNPKESASDSERKTANDWLNRTLSTRKVDKAVTASLLIMQRLHEDDPTGNAIAKDKPVKHINLPGELDGTVKVKPDYLEEFYIDGLLDPIRLSRSVLTEAKADLGQYGYAGQIQQTPVPAEAGMFAVDNFRILPIIPNEKIQWVRYWDKAGTQGGGAYTAGVLMGKYMTGGLPMFIIADVTRGQWRSDIREKHIKQKAELDGKNVRIGIEQEPGSGGKESAQNTIRNLAGYRVSADRPVGDKVRRADPYSVQVNAGNVLLVEGDWNKAFIEEHRYFPISKYKDQVDAAGAAFSQLTSKKQAPVVNITGTSKSCSFRM